MSLRAPLTHFLCVPLITPLSKSQLLSSLHQFTTSVTVPDDQGNTSIPDRAIRPLGTLHLTVGVMSLQSKERVEAAVTFLHTLDVQELLRRPVAAALNYMKASMEGSDADSTITDTALSTPQTEDPTSPLVVSLTGLYPMHSPSSTSILYTSPQDPTSRLQSLCEALRIAFTEAGFVVSETRPLLLHATIVNTLYVKDRSKRLRGGGHGKEGKVKRGFDARQILEKYEEHVWAEGVQLDRIAICEMGAKKIDGEEGTEEYVEIGSISLPRFDDDLALVAEAQLHSNDIVKV